MINKNSLTKNRKKERIKISSLKDFQDALKKEGYEISESDEKKFTVEIAKILEVDNGVIERLCTDIGDAELTYIANDIKDLIDYVKKILVFENEYPKLCEKMKGIRILIIDRIEYDREPGIQDNVDNMMNGIEKIANEISGIINKEGKQKLSEVEKEITQEYLYAKDVELLKKMMLSGRESVKETYNSQTKTKTLSIEVPEKIKAVQIKARKGTVEYHKYLNDNVPRMQRLIRNLNKYMKEDENEKMTFRINQSEVLQDSINIAVARYEEKEFRAISGSDEIADYCKAPPLEEAVFKSSRVNKLGKLGIGYDRVNDSEKKIFEEIHKQIEKKVLKNEGNIILYSKWNPCPSCYLVIDQFREKHPNIKIQVKYIKKYGES